MGAQKSKAAVQKMTKPAKDFNILNRSLKQIEKQEKSPSEFVAPRHKTSAEKIQQQIQEHPEIPDEVKKQDRSLIERVNQMHIDVDMTGMPKILSNPDRPLPRGTVAKFSPMEPYLNPKKAVKGCLTLTQMMTILDEYAKNPSKEYCEKMASEYKVDDKLIKNIVLHYFHVTIRPDDFQVKTKPAPVDPELSLTVKERIMKHFTDSKRAEVEVEKMRQRLVEEKKDFEAGGEDPFSEAVLEEMENEAKEVQNKTGV